MIFFLLIGILGLTIGLLSVFSNKFNEYLRRKFADSDADKLAFGERNLRLLRRYEAGIVEILIGVVSLAMYFQSNDASLSAFKAWINSVM